MPRSIVSLIRHAPGAPRGVEPSLEANAYAVASDVELTVVLLEDAVRLAVADAEVPPRSIAGAPLPPSAAAHDLRSLLESGMRVLVHDAGLTAQGIPATDLLSGVEVADCDGVADVIADAQGVLTW